jgi:protein tyrosine/serine phosphatase
MRAIIFITLLFSFNLFAGLKSPFPSTVPGITIPNTHEVGYTKSIYRGMAPLDKIQELPKFGITHILIFKNQTRNEVDLELAQLASLGYKQNQVHMIPFKWNKLESFKKVCEQTIEGLKYLRHVQMNNGRVFFHCTVGEDRTGFLAGLWRMLEQNYTPQGAFFNEMCKNGYSRGNPNKPWKVVNGIRAELTPAWIMMAYLVQSRKLTFQNLDTRYCNNEKEIRQAVSRSPMIHVRWECKKQSISRP